MSRQPWHAPVFIFSSFCPHRSLCHLSPRLPFTPDTLEQTGIGRIRSALCRAGLLKANQGSIRALGPLRVVTSQCKGEGGTSRDTDVNTGFVSGLCFRQVSHHPPISACHAESENFVFWQGNVPANLFNPIVFCDVIDFCFIKERP